MIDTYVQVDQDAFCQHQHTVCCQGAYGSRDVAVKT